MDVNHYKGALLSLLPQGVAWTMEQGAALHKLLYGLAVELVRIDARTNDFLAETFPMTSSESITDFEGYAGLPDPCSGTPATLVLRREAIKRRLASLGGQSRAYYIGIAAILGYAITITEFSPAYVQHTSAGDPINGLGWAHTWRVNAAASTVRYAFVGSAVAGDPLASWGNAILECVLNALKPAHTVLQFSYT